MTTETTTLTAWLLECIEAKERLAVAAMEVGTYPHFGDTAAEEVLDMAENEGCASSGIAFFRDNDPARILATCAAHRAIVELHEPVDEQPDGWCQRCDGDGWPCGTMAALASIYKDAPGFDSRWTA